MDPRPSQGNGQHNNTTHKGAMLMGFTEPLAGGGFFKPRDPKAMPKFLRKSAMGIDSLFR